MLQCTSLAPTYGEICFVNELHGDQHDPCLCSLFKTIGTFDLSKYSLLYPENDPFPHLLYEIDIGYWLATDLTVSCVFCSARCHFTTDKSRREHNCPGRTRLQWNVNASAQKTHATQTQIKGGIVAS